MKMKKIKTVFGILSAFFVLLALTVFVTERYSDYRILTGSADGDVLNIVFSACAAVCLLISAITAIVSKTEKRIVLNSVIRFLIICIIGSFALISASDNKDCKYYEFSSPNGEYTVVAKEWSWLLGGGVVFYERVNPLVVTYREDFSTDDGYRAISSGDYSVEWEENVMSITLQNGNNIYKTVNIIV